LNINSLSSHTKFGPGDSYQKDAPSDFAKLVIVKYGQNFEKLFLAEIKILIILRAYSHCLPAKTYKSFFPRKMPVQVFPVVHNKPKYALKLFIGIKD